MSKRFKNWRQPEFDEDGWAYPDRESMDHKKHKYGWKCFNVDNLILGDKCDIGCGTVIQAGYGVEIGRLCEVGPNAFICSHSTIDNKTGAVVLENGARVGAGAVIMPNVMIGKNSIVGANAVVPYNIVIPKNEVWVGVPSRKLRILDENEKRV